MCYNGTDVLLIGFSIGEPDSLANVEDLWLGESKLESLKDAKVDEFHTYYPFFTIFQKLLVGLKADLKDDQETKETLAKRDLVR